MSVRRTFLTSLAGLTWLGAAGASDPPTLKPWTPPPLEIKGFRRADATFVLSNGWKVAFPRLALVAASYGALLHRIAYDAGRTMGVAEASNRGRQVGLFRVFEEPHRLEDGRWRADVGIMVVSEDSLPHSSSGNRMGAAF